MRHPIPEIDTALRTILNEDGLDSKVIRMWSKREFNAGLFYKTGFETLLFNKNKAFALDTVLSSVVSLDDEVLLAGYGKTLQELENKADEHGLAFTSFNWFLDGWTNLRNAILSNKNINTLVIGIDADTDVNDIPVEELFAVVMLNKINLIVYCETDVEGLNDQFKNAIDFMIGECDCHPHRSFVVARRSKLVQTEGISRSFNHNLYTYWQWSMRNRHSIIEPMCG